MDLKFDSVSPLDYFASLVQSDEHFPLLEAAASLAQDEEPELDVQHVLDDVARLLKKVTARMPPGADDLTQLAILNQVFYKDLGFGVNANDFYAPENSYLQEVLRTRRGIPISLAIIYIELAQQVGLDVKGISFPGHFLMKLSVNSGDIILDPFNGASLSREDIEERLEPYFINGRDPDDPPLASFLEEASPRSILARMLRNLKTLFSEHPHWKQFLNVQQRLVILLPEEIAERRDRGLAYANLDCPQAALQDLEAYLDQCPQATDAESLRRRLPELRAATEDLLVAFPAADHTHRGWRLAAVQMIARAKAPLRINAVSGGSEEAIAAAAEYLARAPGLTGQLISLDDFGAGAVLPLRS